MSPYVWLTITAEGMPTSSSIVFIGKPSECAEWVRNATYERDIRPKIRYELKNGFWFRFRKGILNCRLSTDGIERKFNINVK